MLTTFGTVCGYIAQLWLASQLGAAVVFDAVGAFGFDKQEVSARRLLGVALAVLSAIAYQYNVR